MVFNWFICWMFGHTSSENMVNIDTPIGKMCIAYCSRCGCTISYDDDLHGWVKW